MSKIILIFIFALLISGCSFSKNQPNYFSSTISLKSKIDTTMIADDMFEFMSHYYAPNKTILYLDTNDFNKNFHNYIVQKFKEAGYAVTSDNKLQNLTFFSYKITHDATMLLVTYYINESKISRVYTIENDRLIRIGGIARFNFTREPVIFKMPTLIKESIQVKSVEQNNEKEFLHVNTFTEEIIHPKVIKTEKRKEEKTLVVSKKDTKAITPPKVKKPLKSHKIITPQVQESQKEVKVPLAIDENWKPVASSKADNNSTDNSNVLVMVEELNKNSLHGTQEAQKETKAPLVIAEEAKPIETPKITTPAVDTNTSVDAQVIDAAQELKSVLSLIKDENTTVKQEAHIDINTTKVKDDMNATHTIENDTKPKIETVTVQGLPFELKSSKEPTLVETIDEALRVYPDFDKEKLRADLLRLAAKNPEIDIESVRTMPFTKGLLLELLKVAKGTRN